MILVDAQHDEEGKIRRLEFKGMLSEPAEEPPVGAVAGEGEQPEGESGSNG